MMSNVLVIGTNGEVVRRLETTEGRIRKRLKMTTETWKTARNKKTELDTASVLVLDLTDPDAPGSRSIRDLRRRQPDGLLLIADTDMTRLSALASLLEEPTVDFTRVADPEEILYRLNRLLLQSRHLAQVPAETATTKPLLKALHDPDNGRLNAKRIADYFHIALADVARATGFSLARIHKTPSAPSVQARLYAFEHVAVALRALVGSRENALIWLNLPEKQIADKTPLALILEGRGEVVAEMLEDMLLGQPA